MTVPAAVSRLPPDQPAHLPRLPETGQPGPFSHVPVRVRVLCGGYHREYRDHLITFYEYFQASSDQVTLST